MTLGHEIQVRETCVKNHFLCTHKAMNLLQQCKLDVMMMQALGGWDHHDWGAAWPNTGRPNCKKQASTKSQLTKNV